MEGTALITAVRIVLFKGALLWTCITAITSTTPTNNNTEKGAAITNTLIGD